MTHDLANASTGATESELIARAQSGDRAALETLLAQLAPSIHRFGMRMCRNPHDAEDVLQDALLGIANHLGTFEGRSSLSSWAFALTRSACARKRRGLKNRPTESDERLAAHADAAPGPEATVADKQLAQMLSAALDTIADDYREVIALRDIEGLSAPETAIVLGLSVDAVKSRLHRAREALRAALKDRLDASPPAARTGCPDIDALWSKKLDGDLSQTDCAAMERHIESCASCNAACDALKSALIACQRARTESVPPYVQERVRAAVRAWAAGTLR